MANEYIANSVLEKAIIRFQTIKVLIKEENSEENTEEFQKLQIELANLFYLLSENIVRAFGFKLIDKEDALQEGVMICLSKLDSFNPSKGKSFNYYTTVVLNHFRQLYRGAKNQNELQKRYYDHLVEKVENMFLERGPYGETRGSYRNPNSPNKKSKKN